MPAFDSLQRASFDGLSFPIKSVSIELDTRHHQHVYLKTPGAATEKMARGLYKFAMNAVFDTNIKGYPGLWPTTLAALRQRCETQKTAALVVPTLGTVQAWIPSWKQEADFTKVRSGETSPITFWEDSNGLTLSAALAATKRTSLDSAASGFASITKDVDPTLAPGSPLSLDNGVPRKDVFQLVQDSVNSVLAVKDQSDLFGNLFAAKIQGLADLLREVDRDLVALQHPVNYPVIDALHDLLAATIDLGRDVNGTREPRIYRVKRLMTVAQISSALYGDTSHAPDLMQNNALRDPFAVDAGEEIIYYPAAA